MTWLTVPTVLLVVTLCVSCAEEKDILEVRYLQKNIAPARGSSVTLSCMAYYDLEKCGLVHVVWRHLTKNNIELTDPNKYLTVVNETFSDNMRLRQVETEILNLTLEDNGAFQCMAACESGETAMGHFIQITVKDGSSD